jgi:hypothetical protein
MTERPSDVPDLDERLRPSSEPVDPSELDGDQLLKAMLTPDETTLRFSGYGFGGRLMPRDSAEFLAWQMSQTALAEEIPDDVREVFARVQKVFIYGLLDYDFFTVAASETHLALEGALRARFVSWYNNKIPLLVDGELESLTVATFNDLFRYLRDNRRGGQTRLAEDPPESPPRSYPELFTWARARGLLAGQRNVGVFDGLVERRNDAAHPERHSVYMPPSVYRLMRDAAEIINHLWGVTTPGGRMFPGPVARLPRLFALSFDATAAKTLTFADLTGEDENADWSYTLVLAAEQEELWGHDPFSPQNISLAIRPGSQTTEFPAEILHGPCGLADMLAFVQNVDETEGDAVEFQDRIFYVRATEDEVDPVRSAGDLARAKLTHVKGDRWYVLRADHPIDAFCAVRDHRPDVGSAEAVDLIHEFATLAKAKAHAKQQLAT